ncbi:hypothetical protein M3Y99_01118800 [Aphelenchoides fujianensis]|nr:hypothetical protein M3Y99_01118800 [Aphelenchoides fujianensis]
MSKPTSGDRRMCGFCDHSLGEEAIMALQRLWHPDCFRCAACKKPIRQSFQASPLSAGLIPLQVANGAAFCVQCFASSFNPKCAGCGEMLVDTCLMALEKHWHPRCFCCSLCSKPLPNGEYFLVDDKPYDLDCHWEKRLDKRTAVLNERHQYE